ncbi:hypothetical protein O6H91_17G082500 [Diphasiastrum complanatum]|uniref:Uncharacterized protein n=1 Tax=Diphasiastrum complanatum TaxID=34168 RepID=A0ACC2B8T7_DIPCM|nr:hypothetical protein O6H91_17G082500 [Diphasiastrum complanatum]
MGQISEPVPWQLTRRLGQSVPDRGTRLMWAGSKKALEEATWGGLEINNELIGVSFFFFLFSFWCFYEKTECFYKKTAGSRHRAQIHPPKQQQQLRTMEIEQDDPATTTLQALPADNLQFSLSNILTVPLQFLGSRVKNKREAEVILEISRSANLVDCILRNYECTAAQTQALHEAWDTLWLSREPLLVTAIPLIGQRMSEVNQQRAMLINKLDIELCKLQVKENSLLQFVDMNLTINKVSKIVFSKLLGCGNFSC